MSAKSLFYSDNKKFSKAEEKAFAREELIYNVTEDLLVAMEDAGISKAELARKLSKGRAFVSQILSGQRNMTLGTLSDICYAIGAQPQVKVLGAQSDDELPEWQAQQNRKIKSVRPSNVIYLDDYQGDYATARTSHVSATG